MEQCSLANVIPAERAKLSDGQSPGSPAEVLTSSETQHNCEISVLPEQCVGTHRPGGSWAGSRACSASPGRAPTGEQG